ncbi:MAG: hypothetical protein KJ957_07890 [Candidatus Omnitrophica bacterium]|nr:hypothetical protein [Candidatus Omnitrophota bacterium]
MRIFAQVGPTLSTYIQKLRLYLELDRSSIEAGGIKNECWFILMSPCKEGVIEERSPASLARG